MQYSQEKLRKVLNEDFEYVECPACGRNDFKNSTGIKYHHAQMHGFSIKLPFRCEECGLIKSGDNSNQKTCSECNWNDDDEEYACPWEGCGRTFTSRNGRSVHHNQVHGESIAGYEYECEYCGDTFESRITPDSPVAPKYCPPGDQSGETCESKDREGTTRPEYSDEWKENISKGMKKAIEEGRAESPFVGASDEWRQENIFDKRDNSYLHESLSEEVKGKVSETLKEGYRTGRIDPPSQNFSVVEETGHKVDSSWEKEVDLLFYNSDFDYKYNSDENFPRFEIDGNFYIPDFVVEGSNEMIIVEVKGWLGYDKREEKVRTYAEEMTKRDDIFYVVYGNIDLQCDAHVGYGDERKLLEVIKNKIDKERSIFHY